MTNIVRKAGHVVGVHTWTEGFTPLRRGSIVHISTERDAQCHALYLERTVSSETGMELLDRWLAGCRYFYIA